MTFDVTKPVQTRDGRKARIICTNKKGSFPIVAIIEAGDSEGVLAFNEHGERSCDDIALVNVPVKEESFGLCSHSGIVPSFAYDSLEGAIERKPIVFASAYGVLKRTTIDNKLTAMELAHVF